MRRLQSSGIHVTAECNRRPQNYRADAVLSANVDELDYIRDELIQKIGAEGLVDTAATIASFNSIVRIAIASGTQLDRLVTDQLYDLSGNTSWLNHVP
jgi:DNA-binding Lrp family transcriptional regulator